MKNRSKLVNGFIITTFVSLYLMVSVISTIHVIDFFKLSNPTWLAVSLAIAFEIGAAASLASLIAMEKMNKSIVWFLFILLTAMQAMGNTYYAFVNLGDYQAWAELFGLIEEEEIFQKRVLSIISGAVLPIVALGFIKSLVDYIKPDSTEVEPQPDNIDSDDEFEDMDVTIDDGLDDISGLNDISEPFVYDHGLERINIPGGEMNVEYEAPGNIKEQVSKNKDKKPLLQDNIEIVNVNSNKTAPKIVDMPTDPDINPTRL